MPTNVPTTLTFEVRAKEFDEFLRKRIEQLNQLLSEGDSDHRVLLKTERAEAEGIYITFKRMFADSL